MSKLALEGMRFYAYHGFYEAERRIGGYYEVDVELELSFDGAAQHDDLEGTVNYETIYYIVKQEMRQSTQLIERLGQRIVDRIRVQFEQVQSVRVTIIKERPPVGGEVRQSRVVIEASFVVSCGKCGRGFLSQAPGDCWTKHGYVYPETKATLIRSHGPNICKSCLGPYFAKELK